MVVCIAVVSFGFCKMQNKDIKNVEPNMIHTFESA